MATLINAGPYTGPSPLIHPESEPFWRSIGNGDLRLQQCSQCATIRFPIAPVCYKCGSLSAEWATIPTTGRISAAIRVERAIGDQAWAQSVPFITALVDMDSGHRLPGRILCSCGQAMTHGTPVTGGYLQAPDGWGVLCFLHHCTSNSAASSSL